MPAVHPMISTVLSVVGNESVSAGRCRVSGVVRLTPLLRGAVKATQVNQQVLTTSVIGDIILRSQYTK